MEIIFWIAGWIFQIYVGLILGVFSIVAMALILTGVSTLICLLIIACFSGISSK